MNDKKKRSRDRGRRSSRDRSGGRRSRDRSRDRSTERRRRSADRYSRSKSPDKDKKKRSASRFKKNVKKKKTKACKRMIERERDMVRAMVGNNIRFTANLLGYFRSPSPRRSASPENKENDSKQSPDADKLIIHFFFHL